MGVTVALAHQLIREWFAAALLAVDPEVAIRRALGRDGRSISVNGVEVPVPGRLVVVGVGKAAVPMARGVEAVCGDLIDTGLVITKDGHANDHQLRSIDVREASHPIPDERGVQATRDMLNLLSGLDAHDVVLAIISGGGSALLESPKAPVTLADMAKTTDLLLRAGAPIQDLNRVRIPLSDVKGGGLRRAAGQATMITLILSDVLGNDTRIIASGPTVRGDAQTDDALRLLDQYEVRSRVPSSVISALEQSAESALEWNFPNDIVEIIADNETAVDEVVNQARSAGFAVNIPWLAVGGEAAALGRGCVDICRDVDDVVDVLVGGGETTVTVLGDGIGGRNTEFALAGALALGDGGPSDWVIASLATDGQDGPTGVAGAIADAETVSRSRNGGISPDAALANNDSLRVFEVAGGVVDPGPTGTNVNDLYFAVRVSGK